MQRPSTITAIATAPGRGGVGIVRVSGPKALAIAEAIIGFTPRVRHAHFSPFKDANNAVIDEGVVLYFAGPHSFTGEDVVEFQGHGGPVILDMLMAATLNHGAVLAKPGEFSERAFLNDKLDLTQAEAIADLIAASSQQAAKQALNSLQGAFSNEVNRLVEQLIHLRIYVEAAIDFPEEEVDFLSDGKIAGDLAVIMNQLTQVLAQAQQGCLMREGMKIVIAGRPNAGKSSLLNALTEKDSAIVTDIAGTTRDVLREHIHIDGMPLHLIDTAGLHSSTDVVEQLGIARAWQEIKGADRILLMIDSTQADQLDVARHWPEFFTDPQLRDKITLLFNKIDLANPVIAESGYHHLAVSTKTGVGLNALRDHLKTIMGFTSTTEGGFSARRRHLDALHRAQGALLNSEYQLLVARAGELVAEELRLAQDYLGEITGKFTPDDLLGKIFSSFCIGK